ALATLSQERESRPSAPHSVRRRVGSALGRGQPRSDLLAGRRLRLCQCGVVAGPADEPASDRAVELEGGLVRQARAVARGPARSTTQKGETAADAQGDDRGYGELPRRV